MKKIIFVGILTFLSANGFSQQGAVTINQDEEIDQLLTLYKSTLASSEFYRIQVGFGSHAQAEQINDDVQSDYPDLPSKIDFDSPTYRVRIGKFKTQLEAERKFNEVRLKYPNAMLLKPKKSAN